MSIFIIIIQYCLAVIAHAIRQGKEKRAIKIGDKVKAYLYHPASNCKDVTNV